MTTIRAKSDVMTLINMSRCTGNQRRLVDSKKQEVSVRRARVCFCQPHRSTVGPRSRVCTIGGVSMSIRRCVRLLPRFRFFRKRSRSPSLKPAVLEVVANLHNPWRAEIEATTVCPFAEERSRCGRGAIQVRTYPLPPTFVGGWPQWFHHRSVFPSRLCEQDKARSARIRPRTRLHACACNAFGQLLNILLS